MESRIDYAKVAPGVRTAMWALEEYVHQTGLEPALLELVKFARKQFSERSSSTLPRVSGELVTERPR
jgi:hypothetical protein